MTFDEMNVTTKTMYSPMATIVTRGRLSSLPLTFSSAELFAEIEYFTLAGVAFGHMALQSMHVHFCRVMCGKITG